MKLSIIIPVWNNWSYTQNCLKDLSKLPEDHEIILVDNGSVDTTKMIHSGSSLFHENLKVIHLKKNRGFAIGSNTGYAQATGEFVMFLNNDIRVRKSLHDWTLPLIEGARGGGLVGPTVGILDDNFNFLCETSKIPDRGQAYISGWNLTASRETFEKLKLSGEIGPFYTGFGTYFEDTDLSFRARKLGIPLTVIECPVHHFGKVTSKKLDTLKLYLPAKKKFIKKWGKNAD